MPRPILNIRQAAEEMGVSERTIYRYLRSGKLIREKSSVKYVNHGTDNDCQSDRFQIKNAVSCVSKMTNPSDTASAIELEQLKAAVREKDNQIENLLAGQREMSQTIQRLQEQMFELARLVLTQKSAGAVHSAEPLAASEREKSADWRKWLSFIKPASDKKREDKR